MQHALGARIVPENALRLSVSLVGRPAVRFNGRSVELRTQKANAVLGYLALTETKHESRERLVGLFWSALGRGKGARFAAPGRARIALRI